MATKPAPSKSRAAKKAPKGGSRKAAKPAAPRKAAKAVPRKAPKKAAKRPARKAAKPKAARPHRMPAASRPAMKLRALQASAEPSNAVTPEMARAEHEHQDPRGSGGAVVPRGVNDQAAFNYGQFKNKAVARNDKPVNWFRRGPKPPQS